MDALLSTVCKVIAAEALVVSEEALLLCCLECGPGHGCSELGPWGQEYGCQDFIMCVKYEEIVWSGKENVGEVHKVLYTPKPLEGVT